MHNGNGRGYGCGFGKRWLLIGLLILGGIWLVNDAYEDGYRDALVRTGQAGDIRHWRGGDADFPWGLLIVGGIAYIAWRKGAFDRFNGPGNPFDGPGGPGGSGGNGGNGNGQRGVQPYGGHTPNPEQGSGFGAFFRGPRAVFDEWHQQAHEAHEAPQAPSWARPAPPVPPAGPAATGGTGAPGEAQAHQSPPPPPPAPDYWTSMSRPPEAHGDAPATGSGTPGTTGTPSTPGGPATPPSDAQPGGNGGSATPERW